jgi:peroxiredoxin-like protein
MEPFPHHYQITATGTTDGPVRLVSEALPEIATAPPAEFGGPGDAWSPEALLVAAVADCYVLSFRAVASASKFDWLTLSCDTSGKLDRQDRVTRFTEIVNRVHLKVASGTSEETARRLLQKAEDVCLISNSLSADVHLDAEIEFA